MEATARGATRRGGWSSGTGGVPDVLPSPSTASPWGARRGATTMTTCGTSNTCQSSAGPTLQRRAVGGRGRAAVGGRGRAAVGGWGKAAVGGWGRQGNGC